MALHFTYGKVVVPWKRTLRSLVKFGRNVDSLPPRTQNSHTWVFSTEVLSVGVLPGLLTGEGVLASVRRIHSSLEFLNTVSKVLGN